MGGIKTFDGKAGGKGLDIGGMGIVPQFGGSAGEKKNTFFGILFGLIL